MGVALGIWVEGAGMGKVEPHTAAPLSNLKRVALQHSRSKEQASIAYAKMY